MSKIFGLHTEIITFLKKNAQIRRKNSFHHFIDCHFPPCFETRSRTSAEIVLKNTQNNEVRISECAVYKKKLKK